MATLDASYEAVPVRVLEDELEKKIEAAIRNSQHFYIGVASEDGTPIQSMCHREGTHCKPDDKRCSQASRHHADTRAKRKGLTLEKVFYADKLIVKDEVCELEMKLIAKYKQHDLCLNVKSGRANCIKRHRGIVYVRTYRRLRKPETSDIVETSVYVGLLIGLVVFISRLYSAGVSKRR